MLKIEDGKKYMQIDDLVLAADISFDIKTAADKKIPLSVWDKVYAKDKDNSDIERYIELSTPEESSFYDSLKAYIYEKNELDKMKNSELRELETEIEKKIKALKAEHNQNCHKKDFNFFQNAKAIDINEYRLKDLIRYRQNIRKVFYGYFDTLDDNIRKYFLSLVDEFPIWLEDYINIPEMKRLSSISYDMAYLTNGKCHYSQLEYSLSVALIIWNLTRSKKLTLAGFLNDIARPYGYSNMSVEEELAYKEKVIKNSKDLILLLENDGLSVDEVLNPRLYQIFNHNNPRVNPELIAKYFIKGLIHGIYTLEDIKKYNDNLIIVKNEDNFDELAFKELECAEKFASGLPLIRKADFVDSITKNFINDICVSLVSSGSLSLEDLYSNSEKGILDKIQTSQDEYISSRFAMFAEQNKIYATDKYITDKYMIKKPCEYIDTLVFTQAGSKRISKMSAKMVQYIQEVLDSKNEYIYLDIEFTPYIKGYSKKS